MKHRADAMVSLFLLLGDKHFYTQQTFSHEPPTAFIDILMFGTEVLNSPAAAASSSTHIKDVRMNHKNVLGSLGKH